MKKIEFKYNSLEDFLIANPLSIDTQLDDGGCVLFSVKGREIEASVLFADISSFSSTTKGLSSIETLIYLNHFFTWITAEGLVESTGIVDKYIGDEIMLIFSNAFGSEDSLVDALKTAKSIADHDPWDFSPHMGIASGVVTVGYVGTPIKYNCSAFGTPVNLAKRCAGVKPNNGAGASIIIPEKLWEERLFDKIFPPIELKNLDGKTVGQRQNWKLTSRGKEKMKNMDEIELVEIDKMKISIPSMTAEERAKEALSVLREKGNYKPIFE
jgi:class 3 adenylate cyclase